MIGYKIQKMKWTYCSNYNFKKILYVNKIITIKLLIHFAFLKN